MLKIFPVETYEDIEKWCLLKNEFLEYLESKLPRDTDSPPKKSIPRNPIEPKLIASFNDIDVGCVGLRKENDEICEMLMLYVQPEFRGKKIGKKLAKEIIRSARKMGFQYIRLITYCQLDKAVKLYRSLGFKEIAPYEDVPLEGAVFMELKLC
jgi:ribosomal protein S18 acetylase RimI-like enzyme